MEIRFLVAVIPLLVTFSLFSQESTVNIEKALVPGQFDMDTSDLLNRQSISVKVSRVHMDEVLVMCAALAHVKIRFCNCKRLKSIKADYSYYDKWTMEEILNYNMWIAREVTKEPYDYKIEDSVIVVFKDSTQAYPSSRNIQP